MKTMMPSAAALSIGVLLAVHGPQVSQAEPRTSSPPGKGVAEAYAALHTKRTQQLARLKAYTRAGVYPHNTYRRGAVPVFVDARGVRCAVGHLMHVDGERALVEQTRRTNNFVRLHQVKAGPILDWILDSGLTREECELIQPSYDFERPRRPKLPTRPRLRQPTDQPAIQARLEATERLLRKLTPQALETATRRLLPRLSIAAGGALSFEIVELRKARLTLVPVHVTDEPTWLRVTYLDAQGAVLRSNAWQRWTPGKRLSPQTPPAAASRVLIEQAL